MHNQRGESSSTPFSVSTPSRIAAAFVIEDWLTLTGFPFPVRNIGKSSLPQRASKIGVSTSKIDIVV